jgi:alkanesulfonate monooxygenase SsuD/methylene tetrahydromethanopterin reductase-like flavin-dependent oxidoreductase (luciferase family)
MDWATHGPVPIWVAGYGPMALAAAGRVADGIILQLADPDIIRWCIGFVRAAAEEAGRDPDAIQVMAAAAAFVADDVESARERVRWFPALVSNHVVDLINKYDKADLPEALWHYVENREGYDYHHHAEVGSDNATFVSDQIVDRFAIVGPPDAHTERLRELRDAGVTQFNIYLMSGDEEEQLDRYAPIIERQAAVRLPGR